MIIRLINLIKDVALESNIELNIIEINKIIDKVKLYEDYQTQPVEKLRNYVKYVMKVERLVS